jgi:hypothetical protein
MGNPGQFIYEQIVLTECEIALLCSALDRARTNSGTVMLAEYDALYMRWADIANDESTLIVSDPTVGGHRMHAVETWADERHRLRIVVDAHIVFVMGLDDEDLAREYCRLAARLGGTS